MKFFGQPKTFEEFIEKASVKKIKDVKIESREFYKTRTNLPTRYSFYIELSSGKTKVKIFESHEEVFTHPNQAAEYSFERIFNWQKENLEILIKAVEKLISLRFRIENISVKDLTEMKEKLAELEKKVRYYNKITSEYPGRPKK